MAIANFQQTIWSKIIQTQLDTITSLKDHCDFEFEGDIRQAEKVKILGVTRPTIRTYIPGTDLVPEAGTDSSQFLNIDQYRYYDFYVEDIDKVQSVPGLIEKLTMEGTKGLAESGDEYVATIVVAAVTAAEVAHATSADVSGLTAATTTSLLDGAFQALYDANCKVSDVFHLEITAEMYNKLRSSIITLDTNNSEMIKKGYVGHYNNALVSIENKLGTWSDGTRNTKLAMLRTNKAIAFAGQLQQVEAFRPDKAFQDAVKALYVFGAKVVRPEQVYCLPLY